MKNARPWANGSEREFLYQHIEELVAEVLRLTTMNTHRDKMPRRCPHCRERVAKREWVEKVGK